MKKLKDKNNLSTLLKNIKKDKKTDLLIQNLKNNSKFLKDYQLAFQVDQDKVADAMVIFQKEKNSNFTLKKLRKKNDRN